MTCQHCGSANIVKIQGQNYCLRCGYAVQRAVKGPGGRRKAASPTPQGASDLRPAGAAAASSLESIPVPGRHGWKPAPPRPHPLRFSVMVAAAMAVAGAAAITVTLVFQVDDDVAIMVVLAAAASWLVGSLLAQGALLYGISRAQDGRPAPHSAWWVAARSGFLEMVNVNMAVLVGLAALAAVSAVIWHIARHDLGGSVAVRLVGLGLINIGLVWLALGLYVTRRLAVAAVVVGNVAAPDALRMGWQLYRRGGGHLVAAGLEALLGRLVAAAGLGIALYAVARGIGARAGQTELIIGGIVAVALGAFALAFVMLEWESRVWLRQYRHWVTTFGPAERVRLLTGRVQPKPHRP